MKITFLVMQNFSNDSRVLKQATTLQRKGHDVEVVALHDKKLKEKEIIENIVVKRIKLGTKSLPKRKLFLLLKYIEHGYKVRGLIKSSNVIVSVV